ncbi:MAG: aspartate carbamoyltransferase [Chlamydiae bacterium CG10_big_fil_rev_8_21_14_0_10_35_9]|nr:MAG: aspartate carbamoyltransferase [Chlamydiae bacterium CG10_big_fil_rev_8_21_14_0_10_35_9]
MSNKFAGRDLVSIFDLTKSEILYILKKARELKKNPKPDLLKNKILANCFFEPSTRTKLSFEAAMLRLGGKVIGFSDSKITSTEKGESLSDSMKIMSSYADIIVMRHPLEGSAMQAAEVSSVPVINAGDGANQHPTQTLVDLFTIEESQSSLEDLKIAFVGDLRYGRTAHSLALGLSNFKARMYFISPPTLSLPEEETSDLKKKGIKFSFHKSFEEVLDKVDILYMTRIQKERIPYLEYQKLQSQFILQLPHLKKVKKNMKILHPLPRVHEIDIDIDKTPHAYYFQQAANGVFVREAILALFLGGNIG